MSKGRRWYNQCSYGGSTPLRREQNIDQVGNHRPATALTGIHRSQPKTERSGTTVNTPELKKSWCWLAPQCNNIKPHTCLWTCCSEEMCGLSMRVFSSTLTFTAHVMKKIVAVMGAWDDNVALLHIQGLNPQNKLLEHVFHLALIMQEGPCTHRCYLHISWHLL